LATSLIAYWPVRDIQGLLAADGELLVGRGRVEAD
jgi:hypothetical protein